MASAFRDLRVSDRLAARRRTHRQVHRWRKRARADVRRALILGLMVLLVIPVLAVPAVTAQAVGPLPSVSNIVYGNLQQDTLIYDRHGTLLADIGKQGDHRIVVPLSYVSPWVMKATLATEDRTFYKNSGIDVGGIFRAAVADLNHQHVTQGGSTISQQLVKQLYIGANPAPTLQRKLKEAILAIELNREFTKNQILEMYLDTIYYGSQTYGIEAAARSYFQTNAHDLTLGQAAMLAGLPQAPSKYNPLTNFISAKQRQAQVLAGMVSEKAISPAQAQVAYAEKLQVFPPTTKFQAPYFVDYVLETLAGSYNIKAGDRNGYRVYTSLDLNLQHMAEQIVHEQIAQKGNFYNFHDGALVSMDPTNGEVLAMVGGDDYNKPGGQYNFAYDVARPPGSSFKIFTYTAAIESKKVNMVSPILDDAMVFPIGGDPLGFGKYIPQNYDHRFHGTLPLKMAMGNSLNTLGMRHREAPILSIKDGLGRSVFNYDPTKNQFRAIDPQVAFIIASIMSDDRNRCLEFGCGGDLTLKGRHVAAKTGTTNDFKDNWTIGFTPSLVTAVWVGNPDNKPLSHNSTGIVGAAPIWHKFMTQALGSTADQWYSQPAGLIASGGNYFLPGTQSLPPTLGQPWPQCKLPAHYNPYSLTYAQITVDGVCCVLNAPKPAAPPAAASPAPTPAPSPTSCPNGILPNGQCKPQD
ncbi:MAG: penicillin-binding protein [Chloroflexi bacterium]|nr:MAG: penicillin-binding protein [Chloroflexota bacterium]